MSEQATLTFATPGELAAQLFDQTLTPSMTGRERLRAACLAAAATNTLWRTYSDG